MTYAEVGLQWESTWRPSGDNLEAIDRHFWDWMHTLMPKSMGIAEPPISVSEVVESYRTPPP